MKLLGLVVLLYSCSAAYCQSLPQSLTQVEACREIKPSVVQIDTTTMHGSGFIVEPNGWIITALHVVADPVTLMARKNILVSILGDNHAIPADIVSPLDNVARIRDFAILKIAKANLPALALGSEIDLEDGSPIAIVGIPLSAMFRNPVPVPRFCLSGTIAAQTSFSFPQGNLQFLRTIYFQGVSIKGISGAPIVSLVTGKVIGIVSTRMTGLTIDLLNLSEQLKTHPPGISLSQFDPAGSFAQLVDVLDAQLANGLGTGTGASDAAEALKKAKRDYERQHPRPAK